MPELLSICIPTYNRASYLGDLLDSLISELERTAEAAHLVGLYVSDNASTDSTRQVIESFGSRWPLIYNRNPVNIGGDNNFAQMISRAPGTYFWLIGDDELIVPGSLPPLLEILKTGLNHLVILEAITEDGQPYAFPQIPESAAFPDYAAFVDHFRTADPWRLMLHSFISLMVVKHAVYDQKMGRRMLKTIDRHYAHMYGVVEGLAAHPGCVRVESKPAIRIRNRRALVDTSVLKLTCLWCRYYRWLGIKFHHPDLVAYGRSLFGWKQRWLLLGERIKSLFGLGVDLTR